MSAIQELAPDIVILLAWRYAENFISKNVSFFEKGGLAVLPVPEFKVIGAGDINSMHGLFNDC